MGRSECEGVERGYVEGRAGVRVGQCARNYQRGERVLERRRPTISKASESQREWDWGILLHLSTK